MRRIKYIIVLVIMAVAADAQQNTQYNQYIFNELIINPAYAGTKGIISTNAIFSKQWAGVAGSPTSQTLSIEGPASKKIGLGLHLVNDFIGAQAQQGFFGSYSYKIPINEKYKLSMGLAIGASNFIFDGTKLTTTTPDDPAVPKTLENKLKLDAKTGLFFYSEKLYAGFSVSDLLANAFKNEGFFIKQTRHYYLTTGYLLDINEKLKFKPSFLLKYASKTPTNIDINTFFLYNEKFWLGASIRFGSKILGAKNLMNTIKNRDALIFMTEYYINENLRVGYSYTLTTSVLRNFSGHEISLGYYIPTEAFVKKMITIRYF